MFATLAHELISGKIAFAVTSSPQESRNRGTMAFMKKGAQSSRSTKFYGN
jgi:hypothetical protein